MRRQPFAVAIVPPIETVMDDVLGGGYE